MKTSEQIDKIAEALAKAQAEIKNPEKNKTAKIPMKAGGSYSYDYADLPSTFDCVRGPLTKNGISHFSATQLIDHQVMLYVRLMHSSGQWIESSIALPPTQDPKASAGNQTYFRRYLFNGLVGISGEDDLDSEPETGGTYENRQAIGPKAVPKVAPRTGGVTHGEPAFSEPHQGTLLPSAGVPSPKGPSALATEADRDHIKKLAEQRKWTQEQVAEAMFTLFGKKKVVELTKPEFQELTAIVGGMTPSNDLQRDLAMRSFK